MTRNPAAVVIGGANGIGEATCRLMATRGWRVCVDDATGAPGPVGRWGVR